MTDLRQQHAVRTAGESLIAAVMQRGRVPTAAELEPLFAKLWILGYKARVDDEQRERALFPKAPLKFGAPLEPMSDSELGGELRKLHDLLERDMWDAVAGPIEPDPDHPGACILRFATAWDAKPATTEGPPAGPGPTLESLRKINEAAKHGRLDVEPEAKALPEPDNRPLREFATGSHAAPRFHPGEDLTIVNISG